MELQKNRVLVGLSGGVDSSVSAALLLDQGYEVIGAFMKNWSNCDWRVDRRDAMRVAAKLSIPFETLDFEAEYRRLVVDPMFEEFARGRTPNPDVWCNRYIKFDLFAREADRLGCQWIATGHYARTWTTADDTIAIGMGGDPNKDQSYFLWAMPPSILPRLLFPVGSMEKPAVRAMARERRLAVADKKDSTGICFIGEQDVGTFLRTRIPQQPGTILTTDGHELGRHDGLAFYTIGQREGMRIGGGIPYFVVEKDVARNALIVASGFHPSLFSKTLITTDANWFADLPSGGNIQARIRYRQRAASCTVARTHAEVRVVFDKPQRAITPGQSIVFYSADRMLGGAVIDRVEKTQV